MEILNSKIVDYPNFRFDVDKDRIVLILATAGRMRLNRELYEALGFEQNAADWLEITGKATRTKRFIDVAVNPIATNFYGYVKSNFTTLHNLDALTSTVVTKILYDSKYQFQKLSSQTATVCVCPGYYNQLNFYLVGDDFINSIKSEKQLEISGCVEFFRHV